MADVKHFVTYNQETNRDTPNDDTIVSARALHEIYLPPVLQRRRAGARRVGHVRLPVAERPVLLPEPEPAHRAAGRPLGLYGVRPLRQRMPTPRPSTPLTPGSIRSAGASTGTTASSRRPSRTGRCRPSTINQAVRRILTEMFQFDLFNNPPTGNLSSPASTPADDAFALNVAERGTVLLQNTGKHPAAQHRDHQVDRRDRRRRHAPTPQTAGGGSSHVRALVGGQPAQRDHHPCRLRGNGHIVFRHRSDPGRRRRQQRAGRDRVRELLGERRQRPDEHLAAERPGRHDRGGRGRQSQHDRRAEHRRTGADAVAEPASRAVLEAWYPGQEDGTAIASVLFGDIDPSGHLPETFPTSLSEIPTASPSQFPGVNGQVDYSEGLDVGYRWYDAKHVTPLFPFGYGLSYTSFRFSHLTVTPRSVVNSASGPEAPSRSGRHVGPRHGTDHKHRHGRAAATWSQLYVGDPTAAGEPPRQLEGFRRVTLSPHQSQTVTFAITGHELSYFNTAANGWTLPDGRFSLYVGDSSALTSLPLRGKLTVTKTIGSRYAALTRARDRQSGRDVHRQGAIRQPREPADHRRHRAAPVPVRMEGRPLRHARRTLSLRAGAERDTQLPRHGSRERGGRGQEPDGAALLGGRRRRGRPERDGHGLGTAGPITVTPSAPTVVSPGLLSFHHRRLDQPLESQPWSSSSTPRRRPASRSRRHSPRCQCLRTAPSASSLR